MLGYIVAIGIIVGWTISWHRKRFAAGKQGMNSLYFIVPSLVVAILAIAASAYGIGLRSAGPSMVQQSPTQQISQGQQTSLETIDGKYFSNERVPLDGKRYMRSKFENVTFIYNGGPYGLEYNTINGFRLASDRPEINNTMAILNQMGLLKVPVFGPAGEIVTPTNPASIGENPAQKNSMGSGHGKKE